MSRIRWLPLSALVLAAAFVGVAAGQQSAGKPAKEYRDLPVDGNLAAILKEQLLDIKGMEDLRDLLEKLGKNPEYKDLILKKGLPPAGGDSLDPATRKKLEDLLKKDGGKLQLD